MQLEKRPCGWMHRTVLREGERLTSRDEWKISLRRGGDTAAISMETRFVETLDGQPIESFMSQAFGIMQLKQTMRFTPEGIRIISEQVGRTQEQTVPLPEGKWMTPGTAGRYAEQQIKQGATEIAVRLISPEFGAKVVEAKMKLMGRQNVQVLGKVVPAIACQSSVSVMPNIVSNDYMDETGEMLKSTVSLMPGMTVTVVTADKETGSGAGRSAGTDGVAFGQGGPSDRAAAGTALGGLRATAFAALGCLATAIAPVRLSARDMERGSHGCPRVTGFGQAGGKPAARSRAKIAASPAR